MVVKSTEEISSDFDIGQFLNSYDSLKGQVNELNEILQATNVLRRWDVPSVSFLCCVFVMTLCISFPEFLFAFCLSPILLVILVTYVKSLGESKQVRHIVVMAVESEEESLKRKQEIIERSRRDLRRFVNVLCEIQQFMEVVYGKLMFIQSLFLWKDPQLTIRFLVCIFVLMLLLSFVPLSLFFLASFLYILLNNDEFRKVVSENLSVFMPNVQGKIYGEKDNEDNNPLECYDAGSIVESENSSFEDETSGSDEDSMDKNNVGQSPEKRSKSLVSHLSEYRRRRQELKKGNCAACEVAFSSLLTRRRYCRRCGDKFCSKCCRHNVKKAALGATAPGSRDQRVLVCNDCYGKLRLAKAPD
ncbi:protrudin-like [Paramuricea clavata]|uniref:Protrudin n=1 Tax=Paramuricea clavata TaxID=317549 RepID=A0A7D9HLD9_PARCT|nr:protrudin-like [Paramuricea clavata]